MVGFGMGKEAPIKHEKLHTMPGNLYLTLSGHKTLYVGLPPVNPVQPGQIVALEAEVTNQLTGNKTTVRLPIVIDHIEANAPRAKLTPAEKKLAGYNFDDGISKRLQVADSSYRKLIEHKVGSVAAGDVISPSEVDELFLQTAPASRIYYRLATVADLTNANESVRAWNHDISTAKSLLSSANRDGDQTIADAKSFASSMYNITEAELSGLVQRAGRDIETEANKPVKGQHG